MWGGAQGWGAPQVTQRQKDFPKTNTRAKRQRHNPTLAERQLWKLLRKIGGAHFRRQAPVGPYVFDFADFGAKLLIELDGGIHDLIDVQERDRAKEEWAKTKGYRLIRIPNAHVFGTGEPAIALVMQALRTAN